MEPAPCIESNVESTTPNESNDESENSNEEEDEKSEEDSEKSVNDESSIAISAMNSKEVFYIRIKGLRFLRNVNKIRLSLPNNVSFNLVL